MRRTRKVQDTGRITIPPEVLRAALMGPGTPVEINTATDENGEEVLMIRPLEGRCLFCGRLSKDAIRHENRTVCRECVKELQELDFE